MKAKARIAIAAAVVALGATGFAFVVSGTAGAVGDSETAITGTALEQASKVALAHTKGGRVTDTEVGDEESYYEVEVTLDDGTGDDLQLDADSKSTAQKATRPTLRTPKTKRTELWKADPVSATRYRNSTDA